jgi:predicted dehydrogenase
MADKVRWGVLSTARIAVRKVIPAIQQSAWGEVTAIASRDAARAEAAAQSLGIPNAYGSYEELLTDPAVEAIYNPLPNQLHVPWSIKAAEAGKHVLCEKPLSLTVAEARSLAAVQQRTGVVMAEAFMVRNHPQWLRVRELVAGGSIGQLRALQGCFNYYNADPGNIRNVPEYGGGSLMDIGCYPIHTARFLFAEEPVRVMGIMEQDPTFAVDRLTSAMLKFPSGHATFTCSMQMVYSQRMAVFGTQGRIEIRVPFTPTNDVPVQILIDDGRDLAGGGIVTESFPPCNQYTLQADAFSRAVREGSSVPVPVEDAIRNMAVIEAIARSAQSGKWETP